ncbi:periplasmic copper chaperone A [uncultured Gammaproteobacteria bacterium]
MNLLKLAAVIAVLLPFGAVAGDHNEHTQAPSQQAPSQAGNIRIDQPWVRETPKGAQAGAAYMALSNTGAAPDRLLGGSSPMADKVELHTHIDDNGVMRMRKIDAVEIAPGEPSVLRPGGMHIMLIGLKGQIKQGTPVPLTLRFERGGEVTISMPVAGPGAMEPPHGHDDQEHKH